MAKIIVKVPDIGGAEGAEVIELLVAVGDVVELEQSLIVLESDKASMEIPATVAGTVAELLVSEGKEVCEGDVIVVIESETANVLEVTATDPVAEADSPGVLPATDTDINVLRPEPELEPTSATAVKKAPQQSPIELPDRDDNSVYAGPAVRKLAREFGLDLSEVSGSGPKGRLMKQDLHAFVQKALSSGAVGATGGAGIPPVPDVDFSAFGEIRTEPLTKMAKLTGANMQRNWLNVPHVTQFDDADITELEAFRKALKGEAEKRGTKLTPMPFLLKACAVALRDNPKLCSSLSGDGKTLIYKNYIHLGMAVDTPAGLFVPVIRDVDKKSLWDLADEVIELAGKARDRKLRPDEMRGGCFTLSSLGGIGGRGFTPIVNAPEVGILGVSKADIHPVWDGEEFKPRQMLPLALSYDHRVVNGGDAGRFLTQLVALLSDIRRLAL